MKRANGVAVNKRGELVVVEKTGHCVSVFSPSGERLRSFRMDGSDKELFRWPYGITLDSEGNILVGVWKSFLKLSDEGAPQFLRSEIPSGMVPTGLAFNTANSKIYIICDDSGERKLDWPSGIAIDSNDMVYVSEWSGNRVSVFTSEGQFVTSLGKPGELYNPVKLAVDSSGVVYVCDDDNKRVQIF